MNLEISMTCPLLGFRTIDGQNMQTEEDNISL